MGGSLDVLALSFPRSHLRMDQIGRIFGVSGLGTLTQILTCELVGALFAGWVVVAMILADRLLRNLEKPR